MASGCLTGTVPVGSGQVLTVCIRRGGFDTGLVDDLLLSNMPNLCDCWMISVFMLPRTRSYIARNL